MAYDPMVTAGLMKVYATYKVAHPQHQFFKDMLFGGRLISGTDQLTVETKRAGQKVAASIARFANPNSAEASDSFKISTYTPPYYAERTSLTSADLRNFAFGEPLDKPWSIDQRRLAIMAEKLGNIDDKFLRTEELMCAEALTTGKVKMHDGSYIQYDVDSDLVDITPTKDWDDVAANILGDLQLWGQRLLDKGGIIPDMMIVAPDVFTMLVNDAKVQKVMDIRNYSLGEIGVKPLVGYKGVTFSGIVMAPAIGPIKVYTYANKYVNSSGVLTPYLPVGGVILANSINEGKMMYAATDGFNSAGEVSTVAGERSIFYEKADRLPAVESAVMQMAPLANPFGLDTWVYANVT
ncbi:MAG: hypothetical protein EOM01_09215 [Spirochaetia bacterium]|nr:hypothetical protein [Spirochaetia bacterium]